MGSEADIKAFVTDEVAPGVGLWKIPRGFHLLAVTSWGGRGNKQTPIMLTVNDCQKLFDYKDWVRIVPY